MSDLGYRPLSAQVDLPALDREVIEFWDAQRVFARTLEQTADGPRLDLLRGSADR